MNVFFKITAAILIVAILSLVLSKQGKDFAILLNLAACCIVVITASSFLHPVIEFLTRLTELGEFNDELLKILLKVVGIGMIAQITSLICAESGNPSLGKVIQILTSAVILWICIPLLEELLMMIESVLGTI